jgi:hypothetical protein
MYFVNPTKGSLPHMVAGTLGFIATPRQGQYPAPGMAWCLDNNCFGNEEFNETKWWRWIQSPRLDRSMCKFATAPDVVGDAKATIARSAPWLPRIRELGYLAAFVTQDGSERHPPPWGDFDVLFIGGTNDFKLGPVAARLIREAKARDMWVHCGRVNSLKRLTAMDALGCDSADGTVLAFGPERRLPEVLHWVRTLDTQQPLFEGLT